MHSLSLALQSSIFPLYRRITSLLYNKLVDLEVQQGQPWSHVIGSLFALSTLCRLHDLHPPPSNFGLISGSTLRGQENILNGLAHLTIGENVGVKPIEENHIIGIETGTLELEKEGIYATVESTQENAAESIQSPQSALFSDHME